MPFLGGSPKLAVVIALTIGTNRPGSNTRKVARHIRGIYQNMSVALRTIDLEDLPSEIFAPGAYEEKPEFFLTFSEAIIEADGLVVVTPEYNGGMPGVLKYFIDMLKFPDSFQDRPVCFVGIAAGEWGGLRPVEQLQQIFSYRNAHIYPKRVFIPSVNEALNEEGNLKSAELSARLGLQARGFVTFVEKIKGVTLLNQ